MTKRENDIPGYRQSLSASGGGGGLGCALKARLNLSEWIYEMTIAISYDATWVWFH